MAYIVTVADSSGNIVAVSDTQRFAQTAEYQVSKIDGVKDLWAVPEGFNYYKDDAQDMEHIKTL